MFVTRISCTETTQAIQHIQQNPTCGLTLSHAADECTPLIGGDTVVVGADGDDDKGSNSGSVGTGG